MTEIGNKAGVVVDPDGRQGKPKYASAHDLRRTYGTRWANRIMPAKLQILMRHKSIETTLAYYVGIQADDLAADLWREFAPSGMTSPEQQSPSTGGIIGVLEETAKMDHDVTLYPKSFSEAEGTRFEPPQNLRRTRKLIARAVQIAVQ